MIETKIKKQIRNGGFAGLALAVLTVLQSLLPVAGSSLASLIAMLYHSHSEQETVRIIGLTPTWFFTILNLLLVLGVTFGVFKKNSICAVILFAYGVFALLASVPTALALFGISSFFIIAILVFLYKGMDGTFVYKASEKEKSLEFQAPFLLSRVIVTKFRVFFG